MKHYLLFIFFIVTGISQSFSLSFNHTNIHDALMEIAIISERDLVINDSFLTQSFITKTYQQKSLSFILDDLLKETGFTYKLHRNKITIIKQKQPKYIFDGFVVDKQNGEALYKAYIYIKDGTYGKVTNHRGYFSIVDLEPRTYTFVIAYVGYVSQEITLTLNSKQNIRKIIALKPETFKSKETQVVSEKENIPARVTPKSTKIDANFANNSANLIEPDLFRNITHIAGIHPIIVPHVGFSIRGNPNGDNQILLDGVELYAPYHLGKLFSSFSLLGIRDYEIFKDDIPLKYSDRVSGAINIQTKEGNKEKAEAHFQLSLLTGAFSVEGPIGNGAYFTSLRRSFYDYLDDQFPYYLYDFHGKIYQDLDKKNRLTFGYYKGGDHIEKFSDLLLNEIPSADWGNQMFTLNWRKIMHPRLFSEISISYSEYSSNVNLNNVEYDNWLFSSKLLADFYYNFSRKHQLNFGYRVKSLNIHLPHFANNEFSFIDYQEDRTTHKFFIEDEYSASSREILTLGFALNFDHLEHFRIEPKFSYIRKLTADLSLFIDFRKTFQNEFLISDSELKVNTSILLRDTHQELQSLNQLSIGTNFNFWDYTLDLRGYYRDTYNIFRFKKGLTRSGPFNFDEIVEDYDIRSKGLEFTLNKNTGSVLWQLMYTLSFTDEVSPTEVKPYIFDRRHGITFLIDFNLGRGWHFNGNYYVASPSESANRGVSQIKGNFSFINTKMSKSFTLFDVFLQFHSFSQSNSDTDMFFPSIGFQWKL